MPQRSFPEPTRWLSQTLDTAHDDYRAPFREYAEMIETRLTSSPFTESTPYSAQIGRAHV